MKKYYLFTLAVVIINAAAAQPPDFSGTNPGRLLIVYNDSPTMNPDADGDGVPDSKEIAQYYQLKRNIPDSNMLGLKVISTFGGIACGNYDKMAGWANFWDEMYMPIMSKINRLGSANIDYILMIDPLPYSVSFDPSESPYINIGDNGRSIDQFIGFQKSFGTKALPRFFYYGSTNPLFESSPGVGTDLGQFNHTTFNFYYENSTTYTDTIFLVDRLTAPTPQMAKNLIDMAMYGDKYINPATGYYNGLAYQDTRVQWPDDSLSHYPWDPAKGYNQVDLDINQSRLFFQSAGLNVKWEASGNVIGGGGVSYTDGTSADSAQDALLYSGWYNFNQYLNVWKWKPGSIGVDYNSNSAVNINNACYGNSFLRGAFLHGLTAGMGVIAEPYTFAHPRPEILMYYMLHGYNFIESFWHSNPKASFVSFANGDPLYNPFKKGKTAVMDNSVEPSTITTIYNNDSTTTINIEFNPTETNPEVVKAYLSWGTSTAYGNKINSDTLFYARHTFVLTGLNKTNLYHYQICVIDPVGNTWCSADQVFAADGSVMTGVKPTNQPDQFTIYPNPSTGYFNLSYELKNNSEVQLDVLNMLGENVYHTVSTGSKGNYTNTLVLDFLAKGIYLLKITSNNNVLNKRIEIR